MISIDNEIFKLEFELQQLNIEYEQHRQIVEAARNEIDNAVLDIVTSRMEEVAIAAEREGAYELLDELTVEEQFGNYLITTTSGRTDFSKKEIQNLPNLLKKGKVAKDGSVYRRIPMKKRVPTSSLEAMKEREAHNEAVRQRQREARLSGAGDRVLQAANHFRDAMRDRLAAARKQSQQNNTKPDFKTASSKQDPTKAWVIPAKNLDFTQYLANINDQLANEIEQAVVGIITHYLEMLRGIL